MDVSLVMFTAEGDRRDFAVRDSPTVIGRQADCDLRIPLASVSRQHCEIAFEDGQLMLRDLGSSNGTYHNSSRVQSSSLSAGDEVVVGPVIFTVVIDGYPTEIHPVRSVVGEGEGSAGIASADVQEPGEGEAAGEDELPVVEEVTEDEPAQPTGAHHLAESSAEAGSRKQAGSSGGSQGGGQVKGEDAFDDDDALAALADELSSEGEGEQRNQGQSLADWPGEDDETEHGRHEQGGGQ